VGLFSEQHFSQAIKGSLKVREFFEAVSISGVGVVCLFRLRRGVDKGNWVLEDERAVGSNSEVFLSNLADREILAWPQFS